MAIVSSLYDYIPNWKIAAGQESSKPVKDSDMDITARRLAGGRIQPRRKTLADNDNDDDDDDDDVISTVIYSPRCSTYTQQQAVIGSTELITTAAGRSN